jgi:protein-S-isoprenylcysteine O-methyltransferase Ste14
MRNKSGKLIKTGVYSLIRHPMYLGGMFLLFAMVCFLPHWIMVLLVSINLIVIYRFMLDGDRQNIEKFGEEYHIYKEQVPRMNLIVGIFKHLRRKNNNKI